MPAAAQVNFELNECDGTVLEVTMTSPDEDTLHSGDVEIAWDATGTAADLATYDLYINVSGSSKELIAEDLSGGSHTWDSTAHADVQDADLAVVGTVDTTTYECQDHGEVHGISTDNTGPSVSLSAPSDGDLLEGDVQIAWSTDDDNPDSVDIDYSLDAGGSWSDLHDGPDDGSHSWNTTGLSEGDDYRVRVQATDATGATSAWESTGSFAIDNEAPAATVTAPTGGATLEGAVTVAWDASDLHLDCVDVQVRAGGTWSTVETCNTDGETLLDTTTLDDGDHEIRVAATDTLGHETLSAAVSVSVDNVDPTDDDGSTDDGSTDDGTTDDNSTDDGSSDDGTTDDGSTDSGTTSGDSDTTRDAIGSDRDPGPGVVETLGAVPVPALVALVIVVAIAVGAAGGLWIKRRE